ncbi:glycosyltransferase [uncultured Actinomyces sp.]|uniref:glycosyltransferase family 2 protein n=1 Tax=uncultured Actinomyces sp. TaxID=249061 RepID=UPI00288A84AE|nr:glycosyltransferase [uncultured Actinomyces sp.]
MTPLKLRIVAPARTDRRITGLLGAIEHEARLIGADVAAVPDVPPDDEGDEVYLLVPEELFPRTALTVPALNARAGRLIGLVVMQHLSPRSLTAVRQASRCATAYALGEAETALLSSFHPDARRLRLGYSRTWDRYDAAAPRDTAFVYCGPPEAPIVTAVARAGQYLWRERARAHFVHTDAAAARAFLALEGDELCAALAGSRLLLDLTDAPDQAPIAHLQTIMGAINGAVLVTDRRIPPDWAVPGENCLALPPGSGADLLPGLVRMDEELAELRAAARETMLRRPFAEAVRGLLDAAAENLRERLDYDPGPIPPAEGEYHEAAPGRPATVGEAEAVGASLRRLEERVLALTRSVRRLQLGLGPSDPSPTAVVTTPAYESARPRTSVIIGLCNRRDFVTEALSSAADSIGVPFEIVLQDDGSTDGSFDAVRRFMDEHPDLPMIAVRHELNQGPSATRSDLVERARADYLFGLDAVAGVYPTCLARLVEVLDANPDTAFAHCIVAGRRDGEIVWTMTFKGWNPEQFREGNCIDAMAMLRRGALERVGGRAASMVFGGEDFDLRVRPTEAGERAAFVPQVLAWHRMSDTSMIMGPRVDEAGPRSRIRPGAPALMADRTSKEC